VAWILGYGCTSAAGTNSQAFWQGLQQGRVHLSPHPDGSSRFSFQPRSGPGSARETLLQQLSLSWAETQSRLSAKTLSRLQEGSRVGIILASTKSFIDDLIWQKTSPTQDAVSELLKDFVLGSGLRPPRRTACVSNACSSALAANLLARSWLKSGAIDDVLILSADLVGTFVQKGFECLRVITQDKVRPFSQNRSGFYLGEATSILVLSCFREQSTNLAVTGVGLEAEGYAITRPSHSGLSLLRAYQQVGELEDHPPDLVICHGTGTIINDATEDRALGQLFQSCSERPFLTATKWSVGHTLACSGALDQIAACKVLESQEVFRIETTTEIDPTFQNRYLHAAQNSVPEKLSRILISSLGFGGIHAATLIEKISS